MNTDVSKDVFANNLRLAVNSGLLGDGAPLCTRFFIYLADCLVGGDLADVCPEDRVVAVNYFHMVETAINFLRQQKIEEVDGDLLLLKKAVSEVGALDRQIKELFMREDVVKRLTSEGFYKDLGDIWD